MQRDYFINNQQRFLPKHITLHVNFKLFGLLMKHVYNLAKSEYSNGFGLFAKSLKEIQHSYYNQ